MNALARGDVAGGFNLSVGEPFFLQEVYGHLYPKLFEGKLTYPLTNGDPELLTMLRARMNGQHVIVTNGAKQAILACIHALKIRDNKTFMTHKAPYWPTYPSMGTMSGLPFVSGDFNEVNALRVITAPNNPCGALSDISLLQYDIFDAVYSSPIYGWDNILPWHKMSVWSAAKLFGVSGYRIGWLATPDPELARLAAEYVENTTTGVSMPSQVFLKNLIFNIENADKAQLEFAARNMLLSTNIEFAPLAKYFSEMKGFPDTLTGMFAWVRAKDPEHFRKILAKAKVRVVSGPACGGDDDWFRISFGVLPETMKRAVSAIKDADNGQT